MSTTRYLENQVLSTDPIGLVVLLYEGAIGAVRQACGFLAEGRIAERSTAINKAMQIVAELQGSLDLERGEEVARGLAHLYSFVQERLIEANASQKLPPLNEVLLILSTLQEGWKDISLGPVEQKGTVEAGVMAWTL